MSGAVDVKAFMDRVRRLDSPALQLQVLAGLMGGCGESFKHSAAMTEEYFAGMAESALELCEDAKRKHEAREVQERPHEQLGRIARQARGERL